MYVIGHIWTAREALRELDLDEGEGVIELMLPDLLSAHDWGYVSAWAIPGAHSVSRPIQAHIVGDAAIHFGRFWSGTDARRGWAYRRVGVLGELVRWTDFYDEAEALGLTQGAAAHRPRAPGWAHSLLEYSVDQFITDHFRTDKCFESVRQVMTTVSAREDWLRHLMSELEIETKKPFPDFATGYVRALTSAEQPDELHLRGLAWKFGLALSPESLVWLRALLRETNSRIGAEEMHELIRDLTAVTSDPRAFAYPVNADIVP